MLEPTTLLRPILAAIDEARRQKDLGPLLLIAGALGALQGRVRALLAQRLGEDPPAAPIASQAAAGDRWITLSAAAETLGWSLKTLRRRDRETPLPFIIRRPGEKPCVSIRLLEEFMARERRRTQR